MLLIICAILAVFIVGAIFTVIAIVVGINWQNKNINGNKQFCEKCGEPLTGNTKFCSKCGNKI